MILFFDTETTGLPKNWKAPITDFDNWPRLVQLAYQIFDENGNKEIEDEYLVKPNGYKIPLTATKIHGITNEKANSQGISISNILEDFSILLKEVDTIVAHNLDYDEKILGCEFLRLNLPNPLINKHKICTMKSSTNYCAINGPYGYKWPSLSELHYKLFNTDFEEAHNAIVDIQATSKCFWELVNRGILKLNKFTPRKSIRLNSRSLTNKMSPNSDFDFFNDNDFLNKKKLKNMDIFKQTNWLRGFVDSLALSDSISKRQIESLREKLDLLITSIENQYEEEDDEAGCE